MTLLRDPARRMTSGHPGEWEPRTGRLRCPTFGHTFKVRSCSVEGVGPGAVVPGTLRAASAPAYMTADGRPPVTVRSMYTEDFRGRFGYRTSICQRFGTMFQISCPFPETEGRGKEKTGMTGSPGRRLGRKRKLSFYFGCEEEVMDRRMERRRSKTNKRHKREGRFFRGLRPPSYNFADITMLRMKFLVAAIFATIVHAATAGQFLRFPSFHGEIV